MHWFSGQEHSCVQSDTISLVITVQPPQRLSVQLSVGLNWWYNEESGKKHQCTGSKWKIAFSPLQFRSHIYRQSFSALRKDRRLWGKVWSQHFKTEKERALWGLMWYQLCDNRLILGTKFKVKAKSHFGWGCNASERSWTQSGDPPELLAPAWRGAVQILGNIMVAKNSDSLNPNATSILQYHLSLFHHISIQASSFHCCFLIYCLEFFFI